MCIRDRRSSFGPILNSNVITSFKEFTDGKYNEVMVSDNYEMKVKDDKSIMAAEALSNGANDQDVYKRQDLLLQYYIGKIIIALMLSYYYFS